MSYVNNSQWNSVEKSENNIQINKKVQKLYIWNAFTQRNNYFFNHLLYKFKADVVSKKGTTGESPVEDYKDD